MAVTKSGKDKIGTVLYTEKDIKKRAKELGKQISQDYEGELVLLCALTKTS